MDKYFNEIYKFIIQEDNFEFAYEIAEKFPDIKDKLRNDFWQEVIIHCQKKLDSSFKLTIDHNEELIEIKSMSWDFSLIIQDWSYIEEVYLEVQIDTKSRKKRKELEAIFIDEEFLNILNFEESEEKSDTEAGVILIKELEHLHMLKELIPSKRAPLVNKISDIILEKIFILKDRFPAK